MRNNENARPGVPAGDPVIEELWAVRDEYAASCGYDVDELFRRIRSRQRISGREYVRLPPRRVSSADQTAARRLKNSDSRRTFP